MTNRQHFINHGMTPENDPDVIDVKIQLPELEALETELNGDGSYEVGSTMPYMVSPSDSDMEKAPKKTDDKLRMTIPHGYQELFLSLRESLDGKPAALTPTREEPAPKLERASAPQAAYAPTSSNLPVLYQAPAWEAPEESSFDFRYYLQSLSKSWWLIALTSIAACAIALVVSFPPFATPLFQSQARYLISPSGDFAGAQAVYGLDTLKNRSIVATYAEVLNSRRIYEQLATALSLEPTALEQYTLSSVVLPEASVLEVTAVGPDATVAAGLANQVGDEVVQYLSGAYDAYEVQLLDRATIPTDPVSPNPVQNASIALILGLALGSGVGLLRGYLATLSRDETSSEQQMHHHVYTPKQFEKQIEKAIMQSNGSLSVGLVRLYSTVEHSQTLPPKVVEQLVEEMGNLLQAELRGKDFVGYWHNNSLAVVMTAVPGMMAYNEFQYLQQVLYEKLNTTFENWSISLVPYVGVVTQIHGEPAPSLMQRAERALERAPQSDSVVLFVPAN